MVMRAVMVMEVRQRNAVGWHHVDALMIDWRTGMHSK